MNLPETILQDLRYTVRMLARNAGSTMVTILVLAIGIGINVAVFTAYKAMLTRPLDARDPDEMVNLALIRDSGVTDFTFSYPDYQAYRDSIHSFSGLIAFRLARLTLAIEGRTTSGLPGNSEYAAVAIVSENYFKVLEVPPLRGRTFESMSTDELLASPSVLISENYWQRRFAADPAILGKTIFLNGRAMTVIGITPHNFVGTGIGTSAFWAPLSIEPLIQADDHWLRQREEQRYRLFGRLAAGVSVSQAQSEMNSIADHLRTLHDPQSDAAKPARAFLWPGSPTPLPLNQYAGLTLAARLIMFGAAMVLAVACANVGSLQLARARSRQNEMRTRLSLGAGRVRLIRQLMTESALVGLVSGVLALLVTWALLKALVTWIAYFLPVEYGSVVFDVAPDPGIFLFVFAISLIAGMLSGFVPAMESSRSALSSAVRSSTSSTRSRLLQNILVAVQVALSLVLMIAGTIATQSSIKSLAIDPGYDSNHVINVGVQFPEGSNYPAARRLNFVRELRTRLADLQGIEGVTTGRIPGAGFITAGIALDTSTADKSTRSLLRYAYIQPNYFQTVGIPVILGRAFQSQAGPAERSVVITEAAARELFEGRNAIGRSLRLGVTDERFHNQGELIANGFAYEVIGVVRNTRGLEFDGSDSKSVYLLLPEDRQHNYPMLIRTRSDASQIIKAIDQVIPSIDPNVKALSTAVKDTLRVSPPLLTSGIAAAISSAVGLIGLMLALMGIYGTVSYIVVLRTREVGIRMAVGAQRQDVLRLILGESARPVLAGLVAGIVLAIAASYPARGLLYGLNGVDIVSVGGVSLLFFVIALLAAYPPARHAMRVDPVVALRYE